GYMTTCYFSNLAQRLRVQGSEILPAFSAHLVKWLRLDRSRDKSFKSYYGATVGWGAPNEANGIWERWFPEEEHYVPPGYLSTHDRQGVYRAVAVTERVFDRPFVNKCIRNSVRTEALAEIFPTALFIQCVRNRLDTAQSIWVARTRTLPFELSEVSDPSRSWWSVRPKEYERIKHKGMVEQICEQVFFVEQSIMAARETLGGDRFLTMDYQDLCQKPRSELDRVVQFMNDHGAPTQITQTVPDSFPYATGQKIETSDYEAMADYLSHLYSYPVGPMVSELGRRQE
ncbi:MAG: sulfotransferase, partial [Anaerolineae bacterium]|nr:sulfotransferase [Anaerolineae bacterium]